MEKNSTVNNSPEFNKLAAGEILYPNKETKRTLYHHLIDVEGELISSSVPKGYHVWVALEIDGLLWPKEEEIKSAKWKRKIVKGGPTDEKFKIVLVQVNAEGQCAIESWFRFGQKTGSYPGLTLEDLHKAEIIFTTEGEEFVVR